MKGHRSFSGLLLILATAIPTSGADDWKDALKADLEKTYPVSKRSMLAPDRITEQGIVLVVKKEGITADLSSDTRFSITKVTDGKIGEQGGVVAAVFTKENSRTFKVGERAYVIGIDVKDDYVLFKILSTDMADVNKKGSTKQTRYKGAISFRFAEGFLASADMAKVKAAVDPVLALEGEAAAANTKTIALGQTRQEVEGILGRPDRIVDLGPKVTYVYKDMKVIFTDGKVADVQ